MMRCDVIGEPGAWQPAGRPAAGVVGHTAYIIYIHTKLLVTWLWFLLLFPVFCCVAGVAFAAATRGEVTCVCECVEYIAECCALLHVLVQGW